jgi:RNA-directed DNA polymerase
VIFNAAISQQAQTSIRTKHRKILNTQQRNQTLEWFAEKLNPKIRGWVNYYAKYNRYIVYDVFYHLNVLIRPWTKNTYKIKGKAWLYDKYRAIQSSQP